MTSSFLRHVFLIAILFGHYSFLLTSEVSKQPVAASSENSPSRGVQQLENKKEGKTNTPLPLVTLIVARYGFNWFKDHPIPLTELHQHTHSLMALNLFKPNLPYNGFLPSLTPQEQFLREQTQQAFKNQMNILACWTWLHNNNLAFCYYLWQIGWHPFFNNTNTGLIDKISDLVPENEKKFVAEIINNSKNKTLGSFPVLAQKYALTQQQLNEFLNKNTAYSNTISHFSNLLKIKNKTASDPPLLNTEKAHQENRFFSVVSMVIAHLSNCLQQSNKNIRKELLTLGMLGWDCLPSIAAKQLILYSIFSSPNPPLQKNPLLEQKNKKLIQQLGANAHFYHLPFGVVSNAAWTDYFCLAFIGLDYQKKLASLKSLFFDIFASCRTDLLVSLSKACNEEIINYSDPCNTNNCKISLLDLLQLFNNNSIGNSSIEINSFFKTLMNYMCPHDNLLKPHNYELLFKWLNKIEIGIFTSTELVKAILHVSLHTPSITSADIITLFNLAAKNNYLKKHTKGFLVESALSLKERSSKKTVQPTRKGKEKIDECEEQEIETITRNEEVAFSTLEYICNTQNALIRLPNILNTNYTDTKKADIRKKMHVFFSKLMHFADFITDPDNNSIDQRNCTLTLIRETTAFIVRSRKEPNYDKQKIKTPVLCLHSLLGLLTKEEMWENRKKLNVIKQDLFSKNISQFPMSFMKKDHACIHNLLSLSQLKKTCQACECPHKKEARLWTYKHTKSPYYDLYQTFGSELQTLEHTTPVLKQKNSTAQAAHVLIKNRNLFGHAQHIVHIPPQSKALLNTVYLKS